MLRTQKKPITSSNVLANHIRGDERGVEGVINGRCSVLNAKNTRIQRKPDIYLTTLRPRGNTPVAMCCVPVIMHIRGCYVSLKYDVTEVTSSYTCDIPYERNNELFNT